MFRTDRAILEAAGRRAGSALRVHEALKARPIQSLPAIRDAFGLSFPAAAGAMDFLIERGIARELTGKRRNRLFVYDRYLAILNEATDGGRSRTGSRDWSRPSTPATIGRVLPADALAK